MTTMVAVVVETVASVLVATITAADHHLAITMLVVTTVTDALHPAAHHVDVMTMADHHADTMIHMLHHRAVLHMTTHT